MKISEEFQKAYKRAVNEITMKLKAVIEEFKFITKLIDNYFSKKEFSYNKQYRSKLKTNILTNKPRFHCIRNNC